MRRLENRTVLVDGRVVTRHVYLNDVSHIGYIRLSNHLHEVIRSSSLDVDYIYVRQLKQIEEYIVLDQMEEFVNK